MLQGGSLHELSQYSGSISSIYSPLARLFGGWYPADRENRLILESVEPGGVLNGSGNGVLVSSGDNRKFFFSSRPVFRSFLQVGAPSGGPPSVTVFIGFFTRFWDRIGPDF